MTAKKKGSKPMPNRSKASTKQFQLDLIRDTRDRLLTLGYFSILSPNKFVERIDATLEQAKVRASRTMFIDVDIYSALVATAQIIANRKSKTGGDYSKTTDKSKSLDLKVLGIKGELAILSALNQFRIPYNFDHQLLYMREHKLGPDFILYPSGVTIEVKTQQNYANSMYYNIKQYKKDTKRGVLADVIIALKETKENEFAIEAMGWLEGVKVGETDNIYSSDYPAYQWPYSDLHNISDVGKFLWRLAARGLSGVN